MKSLKAAIMHILALWLGFIPPQFDCFGSLSLPSSVLFSAKSLLKLTQWYLPATNIKLSWVENTVAHLASKEAVFFSAVGVETNNRPRRTVNVGFLFIRHRLHVFDTIYPIWTKIKTWAAFKRNINLHVKWFVDLYNLFAGFIFYYTSALKMRSEGKIST